VDARFVALLVTADDVSLLSPEAEALFFYV
jgi:hypothetical protein